jgi:hypothetical protein
MSKKKKPRSKPKKPRSAARKPASKKPAPKKSELHRALYQAGFRYFECAPWEFLGGEDVFAVRVPGEEHPLAACVLGAAGVDYGLSVLRGPSAAGQMELISTGAKCDPGELDVMSLGLEKYKRIPGELRGFYKKAGVKPSPGTAVPDFVIKPAYQVAREPTEEEVRTLLFVINGVLEAIDRGLLREGETVTAGGLLTLNLGGEPGAPEVEVAGGVTEPRVEERTTPTLLADPRELRRLPLLDETWILACRQVPVRIRKMDDEIRMLLVVDERSGFVLGSEMVHGVEAQIQSARHVVDMMLGRKKTSGLREKRTGRPRNVVFVDEELHEILATQLGKAGIACELTVETPPMMQEVFDGLKEFMERESRE